MDPVLVTLESHTAGDTWQGIPTIGPITNNGLPMSFPITRVRMNISKGGFSSPSSGRVIPVLMLDSDSETAGAYPIIIVDDVTWEISIPAVPKAGFDVTPGTYNGALEITDAIGTVLTTHEITFIVNRDLT